MSDLFDNIKTSADDAIKKASEEGSKILDHAKDIAVEEAQKLQKDMTEKGTTLLNQAKEKATDLINDLTNKQS